MFVDQDISQFRSFVWRHIGQTSEKRNKTKRREGERGERKKRRGPGDGGIGEEGDMEAKIESNDFYQATICRNYK